MYDAVVAIEGGYEPYAVVPLSPSAGASSTAAAGAAACAVLQGMFPNRSPQYQADCAPYQPGAGADEASARGIALGIEVGQQMLLERAGDGRDTIENYVPRAAASATSCLRPPALGSAAYAEAFDEVKELGRSGGAALTSDQQEAARFHTKNPNLFWPRASRVFMNQSSVPENARLAAMLQVSIGDAIFGCFDSKYFFDAWRPRTAIPAAASDGNPATDAEGGWAPFAASPNHPEYPSGHACIAGAVAQVVRSNYGTPQVRFTWTSTVTGTARGYDSVYEMIREIRDARVHGGMHFRYSNDDGGTLGRSTARWVVRNYFRPTDR